MSHEEVGTRAVVIGEDVVILEEDKVKFNRLGKVVISGSVMKSSSSFSNESNEGFLVEEKIMLTT